MTEPKRKRGRPKKIKEKQLSWPKYEGVCHVALRHDHPQAQSHKWAAIIENKVIGYYKNPEEANAARLKEMESGNEKEKNS